MFWRSKYWICGRGRVPTQLFKGKAFGSNAAAWWGFQYGDLLDPADKREVITIFETDLNEGAQFARAVHSYCWTEQVDPFGVRHATMDYPGVPCRSGGWWRNERRLEMSAFRRGRTLALWPSRLAKLKSSIRSHQVISAATSIIGARQKEPDYICRSRFRGHSFPLAILISPKVMERLAARHWKCRSRESFG